MVNILIKYDNYRHERTQLTHKLNDWADSINKYITPSTSVCIENNIYQLIKVEPNKKTLGLRLVYLDADKSIKKRTVKHTEELTADGQMFYVDEIQKGY